MKHTNIKKNTHRIQHTQSYRDIGETKTQTRKNVKIRILTNTQR